MRARKPDDYLAQEAIRRCSWLGTVIGSWISQYARPLTMIRDRREPHRQTVGSRISGTSPRPTRPAWRGWDGIHRRNRGREHAPDNRSVGPSGRWATVGRDAPLVLRQGVSGGAWRCVSALVISVETAVISCAGTNGFAIMTLSGTPFDDQSLFDPPDM